MICGLFMIVFAIYGAITQNYQIIIASGLFGIGLAVCKLSFEIGRYVDAKEEKTERQAEKS